MRWPWQPRETREATGGYTSIISALIGAQAAGTTQQASATAATEAVAGALSRAFADARVDGPADVAEALSPRTLAQIGRDLVRVGESLHVIRMSGGGQLRLFPASTWYWQGGADPADWLCTATVYGPSGSSTWRLPQSSVVFVTWGAPTSRPYHGLSPGTWAADTSRLTANTERSLANETGGPLVQLLPIPQDGGDGAEEGADPLSGLEIRYQRREGRGVACRDHGGRLGRGCRERAALRLEATPAWAVAARRDGETCGVRFRALTGGGWVLAVAVQRRGRYIEARGAEAVAYGRRAPACPDAFCRVDREIRHRRPASLRQLSHGHGVAGASVLEARRCRGRIPRDGAGVCPNWRRRWRLIRFLPTLDRSRALLT